MLIKSYKINKKFVICFVIILTISLSITLFISFANNVENDNQDFIKWVDFNVSAEAMNLTANLDIDSHNKNSEIKYNWIELLSYLACKNGGNFDNFKKSDLDKLINSLQNGQTMEDLTKNLKYFSITNNLKKTIVFLHNNKYN